MSALEERPLSEILKEEFQDEDYRYAYDEEFANSRMATQIKVIREKRGLKQVELAALAEMKQSRISALEDVNYNSWSVSTLRRLARALGVRFAFSFESWGELLPEVEGFGRKNLEKPKFEEDAAFQNEPVPEQATVASGELIDATPLFSGLPENSTAARVQFLPLEYAEGTFPVAVPRTSRQGAQVTNATNKTAQVEEQPFTRRAAGDTRV